MSRIASSEGDSSDEYTPGNKKSKARLNPVKVKSMKIPGELMTKSFKFEKPKVFING